MMVVGMVWRYPKPIRRRSKWTVTKEQWSIDIFAKKGCPGVGYFITGDAIPKLMNAITKVNLFHLLNFKRIALKHSNSFKH